MCKVQMIDCMWSFTLRPSGKCSSTYVHKLPTVKFAIPQTKIQIQCRFHVRQLRYHIYFNTATPTIASLYYTYPLSSATPN